MVLLFITKYPGTPIVSNKDDLKGNRNIVANAN